MSNVVFYVGVGGESFIFRHIWLIFWGSITVQVGKCDWMGEIKDRLKQIRLASKKTQKSMSFDLGLSENTWQTYERGLSFPKFDTLQKLAGAGFSMDWLMTGEGEMGVPTDPGGVLRELCPAIPGSGGVLEEDGLNSFLAPSGEEAPAGFSIDPFLFGRCLDAICQLFQDLKIKASPTILGEEAAMIYQDIAASGVCSLEEQLVAIRVTIAQRRRILQTTPPARKRQDLI